MSGLAATMPNGRAISKPLRPRNPHVPMPPRRLQSCAKAPPEPVRRANSARRTRMPGIRFRFVLIAKVNAREELWMSGTLFVDGFAVPLRRFRKSHHLIPAGRGAPPRDCSWQRRSRQARRPAACVATIVSECAKARSRRHVPPRRHHRFPDQPARGRRGYRRRQQLVVRTLRRRRGDDRLQGRVDRLPAVIHPGWPRSRRCIWPAPST